MDTLVSKILRNWTYGYQVKNSTITVAKDEKRSAERSYPPRYSKSGCIWHSTTCSRVKKFIGSKSHSGWKGPLRQSIVLVQFLSCPCSEWGIGPDDLLRSLSASIVLILFFFFLLSLRFIELTNFQFNKKFPNLQNLFS